TTTSWLVLRVMFRHMGPPMFPTPMKPTFIAVFPSRVGASAWRTVRQHESSPSLAEPVKLEDARQAGAMTMPNIHPRLAPMGIYVQDRDKMERFYTEVLGLMVTDHGEGRAGMHLTFMSGNPQNHHQVVLVTGRPDTAGFNPIQQISFMVDSLADLREVHKRA